MIKLSMFVLKLIMFLMLPVVNPPVPDLTTTHLAMTHKANPRKSLGRAVTDVGLVGPATSTVMKQLPEQDMGVSLCN